MTASIEIHEYTNDPAPLKVQHFQFGCVDVYQTTVSKMENNCFFLVDQRAPENSLLIDASANAAHLQAVAEAIGATVTTIVTTHSHADHVQALEVLLAAWDAKHITSALDAPNIPAPADVLIEDAAATSGTDQTISFGKDIELDTFILRGHTKGGLCLDLSASAVGAGAQGNVPRHLFVGDSLFPGGVGGTNTPDEFLTLLNDVVTRVFEVYEGGAVVHPGHGKATTVGAESPHVDEWRQRGW